ncbi:MAG: ubiquitin-activating E1 FCCH domain-containing protein [Candidatus Puniceispirillales bacterium]
MPRTTAALNSFVSGEFSAKLDGRTDFEKYASGCKTLENMLVHPQGAAARRVGTQFISEVKTSSAKTRLIPFEFSTTQTYVLEFGNTYIRMFKDKGQITEGDVTVTAITKANPGVVTANSHGYANGDFVILSSVIGMTEVNGKTFKVSNKATNTFELENVDGVDVDTSGFTTYSSDGDANRIYEITSPYLTAELFELKFAQSADVMYITHPNHEVMKLSRTGHTAWTLTEVAFTDGPYLPTNTTATTITPQQTAAASGKTLTLSAVTGVNGGVGWLATDVGRILKFNSGKAIITARTNATVAVATITTAFTNTDATAAFNLGAFSDTTGHPSCVSFFEQRLVFAGTTDEPQTLYFSKSGDYENMTTGTNADDAMVYTIASNQVNKIRYLKAVRTLLIGTTGGEFSVSADGTDAAVTPTNVTIKRQSSHGAANVDAQPAGNAVLFLQRAKRKIRELAYNYDSDGYVAPDLTILNETVTNSGITEMAYQQAPDSILWCVRDDGVLAGLTYQRTDNVVAWHRHIIGGKSDTGKNIIQQKINFTANSTIVNGTANSITLASHGLATNDPIYYYAAANPITGISSGSLYYVIRTDANTIKLSLTAALSAAGTPISLTAPGTASTQSIYQGVNISSNVIYSAAHGFKTRDVIFYDNVGTTITGLSENIPYYVSRVDANQFKLYTDSNLVNVVSLTSAHTSEQVDNILQNAKIESVATISGDLNEDELWIISQRWVNGAVRRFVECFSDFDFDETAPEDFKFLDSHLSYSGVAVSSLSGLDHLEGETVSILADGATHATKTVASGAIALDRSATKVTVGLPYSSVLQTMRIEAGAGQYEGTAQAKIKRISKVVLRLFETVGAKVGPSLDNLETVPFRTTSGAMDLPVSTFLAGDKEVEFADDYNTDGFIFVKQEQPLPLTILALYPTIVTNDG